MYEDYLALGGLEIANSARAFGYARTAGCGTGWLKREPCGWVDEALGDLEYTYGNISAAPWYDPTQQDLSTRFLGVYVVDAQGARDSTLTVQQTEGITDGGVIGSRRRGMKSVRVKAVLIGIGSDAIEYGRAWLDSVLSPDACGQHGVACGVADLEFFSACPPQRPAVLNSWGQWEVARRNLVVNPAARVDTYAWGTYAGGGAAGSLMRWVSGTPSEVNSPAYQRLTVTTQGTWIRHNTTLPRGSVVPGKTYTLSAWVKASGAPKGGVLIAWKSAAGSSLGENFTGMVLSGSWARISVTAVAPADASYALLQITRNDSPKSSVLDASGVMFEESPTLGDYFDGSFPGSTSGEIEQRYRWEGQADASTSVFEQASFALDEYRRYMHSVALTSGPFTTDYFESEGTFVDIVEFTLTSERPWVYTKSKMVDLPSVDSQVVQDVAYNLAINPSGELASGTVTAMTNYATNPSVENDAAGWVKGFSVITPAATAARSTDLAAVGTASYKVSTAATNAGSSGFLQAYQDVDVSTLAENTRFSINMWAAALLTSGTAELGNLMVWVDWRSSTGTILRSDQIGNPPVAGGAVSASSLLRPAGATVARVMARIELTSWAVAANLALYVDALAVTVP